MSFTPLRCFANTFCAVLFSSASNAPSTLTGNPFEASIPDAKLHLGAGGCTLCESCSKPLGEPCRHPELALIPMEGCGIDVYNMTKDTPLLYINGQNTVTYFSLMLFSEDENA